MKEWTIMIYFAGDNNLNDEMIRAIDNISGGFATYSDDKIAILAQFDGSHPAIKSRRYNFLLPRNANDYEIDSDCSAAKESIEDFVKACVKGDRNSGGKFPGYKAKKYSLILSGHGDGVMGRTLLLDESPFGVLTIEDLRKTLKQIKDDTTKQKLDVLGIDSCLMNSLEISFEVEKYVKLLVASQGNIPNSGWNYEEIANLLNSARTPDKLTPEYIATEIFTKTLKSYNKPYVQNGGRSLDLSVSDLSQSENLLSSIEDLAITLLEALNYQSNYKENPENIPFYEFPRNLIEKILLMSHWRCQTYLADQSIDIKDFCLCLIKEVEYFIKDAINLLNLKEDNLTNNVSKGLQQPLNILNQIRENCEEVIKQIDDNFVKSGIYSGADNQFSNGVSLFLPWSFLTYSITIEDYEKLKFYKTKAGEKWSTFVEYYTFISQREGRGINFIREKQNPPIYKGLSVFLDYFGRIKNFPNNWRSAEGDFPSDYSPGR